MAEAMLGDLSDVSRVLFPADFNTASAVMQRLYQTRGQIWSIVIPKSDVIPELFTPAEAQRLLQDGALQLDWASAEAPELIITAIGAYQLEQSLRAQERLKTRGLATRVVYMLEPGRFREPRTEREAAHLASEKIRVALYESSARARIFVSHTRPEAMLGVLSPLNTGYESCRGLGFRGRGGTLNIEGMLFVNRCSWAHIVDEAVRLCNRDRRVFLEDAEIAALEQRRSPEGIIIGPIQRSEDNGQDRGPASG
jgi:phosphoketolase